MGGENKRVDLLTQAKEEFEGLLGEWFTAEASYQTAKAVCFAFAFAFAFATISFTLQCSIHLILFLHHVAYLLAIRRSFLHRTLQVFISLFLFPILGFALEFSCLLSIPILVKHSVANSALIRKMSRFIMSVLFVHAFRLVLVNLSL